MAKVQMSTSGASPSQQLGHDDASVAAWSASLLKCMHEHSIQASACLSFCLWPPGQHWF